MTGPAQTSTPTPNSAVSRKILWWLARYPLQRVEDLALATGASINTAYRHLNRLVGLGLAEFITPSLNVKATCRLYHLSNEGLLAAASLEQTEARMLVMTWGSGEAGILRLLPRLPALVPMQNVINGLVARASSALAHVGGYRADISWHWQRDYRPVGGIQTASTDEALAWQADAALLFYRKASPLTARSSGAAGATYYSALLFFDAGLTGPYDHQIIMQRLAAIQRYRDQPARTGPDAAPFPPLLVITQSPLQQETWQRCAADLASSTRTAPLTGSIVTLDAQVPPLDYWTLPWQQLAARSACRLRDLLLPISEQALLPGLLKRPVKGSVTPAKSVNFVRGNFTRRAQDLSRRLAREEEIEEREVVSLLGLCLSQRHRDVLQLCYEHPLLERMEIASLCGLLPESVVRYLYELRRYNCIEREGSRWHLSERGLHFLAASLRLPMQHMIEESQADETPVQRGLPVLREHSSQLLGLYSFFARLAEETHSQPNHALLWWEMGARCERRFQDHGTTFTLRPDAFFACKTPTGQLRAWIEWEDPESRDHDLSEKMLAYAHYIRTREWAAAGWQSPPILLLIVPATKPRLPDLARQSLARTTLIVREASTQHVTERGPLAPIWSQLLPQPGPQASTPPPRRGLLDMSGTLNL